MPERPSWCEKVNCPVDPGGIVCNLDQKLHQEYSFLPNRSLRKEMQRIEEMAEERPQKVIDLCIRKI